MLDRELGAAGVSLNQFEILTWLARAGRRGLRMSDLASRVVLSPSGVTRAVISSNATAWWSAASSKGDKRGSTATLTADGRATLRKAVNVHVRGLREHFLQHLSRTELQQLADALEAILDGEGSSLPPEPRATPERVSVSRRAAARPRSRRRIRLDAGERAVSRAESSG